MYRRHDPCGSVGHVSYMSHDACIGDMIPVGRVPLLFIIIQGVSTSVYMCYTCARRVYVRPEIRM
jgi:hypothetical protein